MPPWIMCDDAAEAPLTKSVALDERDIHALQGQVAERGEAVDAAADDQDVRVRTRRQ